VTDKQNTVDEPERTVRPSVPSRHGLPAPAHPRRSDDGTADERASPFPYAENFDEWVADETAASLGHGSRDSAP